MAKFNVTYSDGTSRVEEASDCSTVEQFINTRFGSSSGVSKVKVTLAEEESKVVKPSRK